MKRYYFKLKYRKNSNRHSGGIMVDALVGSGRLLEASVLEWDKQLCVIIFAQIYLYRIIAKGKAIKFLWNRGMGV